MGHCTGHLGVAAAVAGAKAGVPVRGTHPPAARQWTLLQKPAVPPTAVAAAADTHRPNEGGCSGTGHLRSMLVAVVAAAAGGVVVLAVVERL